MKPYNIHFVCRGNTFRSRLAAAYMATLIDKRFVVSSSGIGVHLTETKTAEPYANAAAQANKLSFGLSDPKTQTTDELLAAADIIVFMNPDVFEQAKQKYHVDDRKVVVWSIPDIKDDVKAKAIAEHNEQSLVDFATRTLKHIQHRCDSLYGYLTEANWADVVDEKNHSTGLRLPISWITDRGFWHRGAHVVARTKDNKFLVGKRVKTIVFAPGMLEVSLGGSVDSGEKPHSAAQRETHEETGILLPEHSFKPLFMYRHVGYHPRYHKLSRCHLYVYSVMLPLHSRELLRPQPGEVDELRIVTKRQIQQLLRKHRLKHFGRLNWSYKFYRDAVAASELTDI